MPDEEELITIKRLTTDIRIPFHVPQNKRKATILPKNSIKVSIKNIPIVFFPSICYNYPVNFSKYQTLYSLYIY